MKPQIDCSSRKAHFFKVLMRDFHQRLRIPPKFMKHIAKEASQRITLQGPNGSSWKAELSETTRGNFLSAGWPNFVKDHSLKEHDFLVFRYNGNMHFSVMIFDNTACEREDLLEMKTQKKSACEWKNRQGFPVKRSLDVNYIVQHQSSRNNKPTSKPLHGQHISPKSTRNGNIKQDIELPTATTMSQTISLSRRCPVTAQERSNALEAANCFRSPFPYTIARMTERCLYKSHMLRLPSHFSRMHLPPPKTNIVLRDPSGKAWIVVYIPTSAKCYLSGGWTAFACGNNLCEGDVCAFELIGEVELQVHIFRAVEKTNHLLG